MNKLIIGLTGYAGAGKDTVAMMMGQEAAQREWGVAKGFAFAEPIRRMLRALGVPQEYMTQRELKEIPVPGFGYSYRQLAQTLGTEWAREHHGEDFWTKATAVEVANAECDYALITDVRFPNEAAWVRSMSGKIVRITRPDVARVNPHASERYVQEIEPDAVIFNAGTLPMLRADAALTLSRFIRHYAQSVKSQYTL
jgi:hypothetical protein